MDKGRRPRRRGITWKQFCAYAARLPGVVEGTSYGTPALRVGKRFLARLKEDGDSVALRIDLADREVLLAADPVAFYLTDHYRPYPAILMRLGKVVPDMAETVVEQAWKRAASRRLLSARAASAGSMAEPDPPAGTRGGGGVKNRRRPRRRRRTRS